MLEATAIPTRHCNWDIYVHADYVTTVDDLSVAGDCVREYFLDLGFHCQYEKVVVSIEPV